MPSRATGVSPRGPFANGAGKTTLVRLLLGELQPEEGAAAALEAEFLQVSRELQALRLPAPS